MILHATESMSNMDVLRERYAERHALEACRHAAFVSAVTHLGLAPSITVHTPKGKALSLAASEVWTARTKHFAHLEHDQHFCRLTTNGDRLAGLFYSWLLSEYTRRYRYLESEEQHQWLQRIVKLVVERHLMETKYVLHLQGVPSFADPWACGVMCHVQELARLPGELARMVHHIVADPTQQTALIEQFHQQTDDHTTRYQVALPEALPPLPKGETLPFTRPLQSGKEHRE